MRNRLHLSTLIAISLIGATTSAFAQGAGAAIGVAPGTGSVPPAAAPNTGSAGITSAPGGPSTTTTGMGIGTGPGTSTNLNTGVNQPGVPNTSTRDITGTGASPSGLPGDDPAHPDFPGKVGQ
jgi:hypothetical protein